MFIKQDKLQNRAKKMPNQQFIRFHFKCKQLQECNIVTAAQISPVYTFMLGSNKP